jgi:HlyD family secretion protein
MKRILIILIVVGVAVGGGLFANSKLRAAASADKTQYKVAKVESGMVKKTVSATGTLQAWKVVDIKSKAGGRVLKMNVDVGDIVTKGKVLAVIDPSDTQLQVNQAQADIDSAGSREQQAGLTWDLQKKQSDLAVQTAQTNLDAAKASLDAARSRETSARQQAQAQPDLTRSSIESARANYDSAVKQLNQLVQATNPQETAAAQSANDEAVANMKNAEANLKRQKNLLDKGFVSQQVVDQAQATYDVSKAQVDAARRKLDTINDEQQAAVATAQARVNQAKAQLDNAEAGKVDVKTRQNAWTEAKAAVNQAQQQVASAQKQLDLARANRANNDIRRADIAQARASKMRAEASYANAKNTLDQTTVTAPSDGVILTKYVDEGTIISSALSFAASGNAILQLGDISRMYVDVTVDETDIANITVGQNVDISVEAYPSIPFEGKVIRIDPQAVIVQNVTMIHVRVEIDHDAPAYRLLKPGMNTTCDFVVDTKEDAVYVPNEALRTDNQGKYVEIAQGGKPAPPDPKTGEPAEPGTLVDVKVTRRPVETGVEGNEVTEITKGLQPGETIVTQKIEAAPQQAGGAFGGGFPGGGRGGGRR